MIRRRILRMAVYLCGAYVMRKGLAWYSSRDGKMALRLAAAGTSPHDVRREHPYGDGAVPVGFPGAVPLMGNRQVVETTVMPREQKTYWRLVYWTEGTAQTVLEFHTRAFEQGGWSVEGPRRTGEDGSGQDGWVTYAHKDGIEVEMYLYPRGSSDTQAISLTVEEPRA